MCWKSNSKCVFLRLESSWHTPSLSVLSCELCHWPQHGHKHDHREYMKGLLLLAEDTPVYRYASLSKYF